MLLPRTKPDEEQFSKFGTYISLKENDTIMVGPFDFTTAIYPAKSSTRVGVKYWKLLSKACANYSLLPPVLSYSKK